MKKIYKFFIIISFILFVFTTTIQASSVVMDLENDITTNTNINAESQNENTASSNNIDENTVVDYNNLEENNLPNTNDALDVSNNPQSSIPTVTTTSSSEDTFLTVENILSIAIIVIGILLILLSIAILIRCK